MIFSEDLRSYFVGMTFTQFSITYYLSYLVFYFHQLYRGYSDQPCFHISVVLVMACELTDLTDECDN